MDTAEISVQSQQSGPSEDEVRVELERILSNTDIQASEKRSAFLQFIVEETLAGRARNLKGYSIAVAVFGRDETFDAQADPIVRLEARRLRRDLDSYYVAAGARDAVRISIPRSCFKSSGGRGLFRFSGAALLTAPRRPRTRAARRPPP